VPDRPGGAASHEALPAALSRLRGVGRSLSYAPPPTRRTRWAYPKTDLREHPVARSWPGRLERPTLPRHQVPLQGAEAPSYETSPRFRSRGARRRTAARATCLPGGRFHGLLREEEPGFPEPRVLSKRRGRPAFRRCFSTGCYQPVDGLPAWLSALLDAFVT
jgi:hypothetical protein